MDQLIYDINGKRYLLIEYLITQNSDAAYKRLFKKYNCIYQGVKEISRGGMFSNPYAISKILVPEENIVAFNEEDNRF